MNLSSCFNFFDFSTDESATENVLKAIQTFASLCGLLDLQTPRDAFITAICKASLPPHYALTVLNNAPQGIPSARSQELSQYNPSGAGEPDYRQQVVAVGTPLPTASLPIGTKFNRIFSIGSIKNRIKIVAINHLFVQVLNKVQ